MATPQRTEFSRLFDIYGNLLTDKQRESFGLYFNEDLSITEIAEENGVSRAAVHDALKTAEKALMEYEKRLGLLAKKERLEEAIQSIKQSLGEAQSKEIEVIERIVEEL